MPSLKAKTVLRRAAEQVLALLAIASKTGCTSDGELA